MSREHPIVWIIGATRSCKTALAQHGITPMGLPCISTGEYFHKEFGQEDTFSRDFVFNLSNFAARHLSGDPECHLRHLQKFIDGAARPCVIEGERNPVEFAKLYDPGKDMVIFMNRLDMALYDTVIERGIAAIEQIVRWHVSTGIAPQCSAFKASFGHEELKADYFGTNNGDDETFFLCPVAPRDPKGDELARYPWINIMIGLSRQLVRDYLGGSIRPPMADETLQAAPAP